MGNTTRPKGILAVSAIVFVFGLAMIAYWAAYIARGMPLEGIPLASEILAALMALATAYGLFRMREWGYATAMILAGMWIYGVLGGINMVVTEGLEFTSPIGAMSDLILFVVVLLFSCLMVGYLWKQRKLLVQ